MALIKSIVEINKDFYEKIKNADKEAASQMMLGIVVDSCYHPCGYGYYSPMIYEEDGKYYFSWVHGSSCD